MRVCVCVRVSKCVYACVCVSVVSKDSNSCNDTKVEKTLKFLKKRETKNLGKSKMEICLWSAFADV